MKKIYLDKNQIEIPFEEAIWRIDWIKAHRRDCLLSETTYFNDKPKELDFLLKITYDITDKDFEYLCKYVLEFSKEYSIDVIENDFAKWEDLNWYNTINGLRSSIQCKQWSDLRIDIKKMWEYFAQTFFMRKNKNIKYEFMYITSSYFTKEAEEFMEYYKIKGINNLNLIRLCKEAWLLEDQNWINFIKNIQEKRILKLRKLHPNSWFKNLKEERLKELTHHLPKYMHPDGIVISWNTIYSKHPFFQYWDLV